MKTKEAHKLEALPEGDAILCGRGKLTWFGSERRSDRYGSVWLLKRGDSTSQENEIEDAKLHFPTGQGKLLARVIEPLKSTHIGDFFRGISPRTPKCGDILILGEGTPFKEVCEGKVALGIRPEKERPNDWLNPRALYDCHESVVELIFIPSL